MRVSQRLIAATVLIALSGALAGCSSSSLGDLDPTSMLDFLDTKKKLPGERKPVFPEGVPGVEQGVPKDLYRGAQEQQQQEAPPVAEAPKPEPKARRSRTAARPPASQAEPAAAPDTEEGAPVATKPTPAPKRKRARITAPQHDEPAPQQQTQSPPPQQAPVQQQQPELKPFPAPLPSGTFQR